MSGWKILLTNFFSTLFSLLLRGRRHSHFSVSHALSLWNNKSSFLIILILCFFRFWWIIYQEWSRTDVTKLLNVFSYWTAVSALINIIIIIIIVISLSHWPKNLRYFVCINVNESIVPFTTAQIIGRICIHLINHP